MAGPTDPADRALDGRVLVTFRASTVDRAGLGTADCHQAEHGTGRCECAGLGRQRTGVLKGVPAPSCGSGTTSAS